MFKLAKRDYEKIAALYDGKEIVFPLILAVIQQKQRGWIFVDSPLHPTTALIITHFGFIQWIGTFSDNPSALRFFTITQADLPNYFLWYSPPAQLQKLLDELFQPLVRRRERLRFIFKRPQIEDAVKCPSGFKVQLLNKDLLPNIQHFKLDLESRFWASAEDFLQHGVGVCILKGDRVVSLCYSACVVNNLAEVDVVTDEKYRNASLATVVSQSFIAECSQRGIIPTWDCFSNNGASVKLAQKLGFEKQLSYFLYSFNYPIHRSSIANKDHPNEME